MQLKLDNSDWGHPPNALGNPPLMQAKSVIPGSAATQYFLKKYS
jgi:hypothetical protein